MCVNWCVEAILDKGDMGLLERPTLLGFGGVTIVADVGGAMGGLVVIRSDPISLIMTEDSQTLL